MKTILVLVGGSETDDAVFDTALDAARRLGAHLDFLHIRLSSAEAAQYTPHVGFAIGAGLRKALDRLEVQSDARSTAAARRFEQLCKDEAIEIRDSPTGSEGVSAAFREERDEAVTRVMRYARHNDLVVVGRPSQANGMRPDLVELLLTGCGRPILIAAPKRRSNLTGTALLCWKETAISARALGAAMPLLRQCSRVVVLGIEEPGESADNLIGVAQNLAWHGISAETCWMAGETGSAAEQIEAAAARHDIDFIVMGGYGHSRERELMFGGCTQHFLDGTDHAVLLMH